MTEEIWKDIPGYEDKYQVSNLGRVLSCDRHLTGKKGKKYIIPKKILKPALCDGYWTVAICKDDKLKTWRIHRLVAMTFIPNPENKPWINHISGVKTDNRIENLEWCTASENQKHAYKLGLSNSKAAIERNSGKFGHLSSRAKEVHQFTLEGEYIKSFKCLLYARREYSYAVGAAVTGKQKSSAGFRWSYSKTL